MSFALPKIWPTGKFARRKAVPTSNSQGSRTCRIEQLEPRLTFAVNASPFAPITWTTQSNGLPILTSFPTAPAMIYLDFDGHAGQNISEFDLDGTPGEFSTFEQQKIVEHWRGLSVLFSMFNVGVTTVEPNTSLVPTQWIAITNDMLGQGGVNGVNTFPDTEPSGVSASDWWAQGYAHEISHGFGNWHHSSYDSLGNKTAEYGPSVSADPLRGGLMGGGSGVIEKWSYGLSSLDARTIQADLNAIAADLNALDGPTGDGYRPDDQLGTSTSTATALTVVNSTTQANIGIIERLTDQDWYSFTSAGGTYNILVGRDYPSPVDVKVSIFNSAGTLIASEDGDPLTAITSGSSTYRTMVNDSHITMNLAAGTYYIKVESHGNYADLGQYIVRVDTMNNGWMSEDVGLTGVSGFANYNASTGTYTVAGSGGDIWSTQDGFQFLFQQLSGEGSITVRVTGMEDTADWAKAGIMFRESLADNAREAYLVVTPHNGVQWSARTSVGGSTSAFTPNTGTNFTPTWLRITRSGNTFTAFKAGADGVFTQFGSPLTVSMGSKVYVGLVSSAVNNTLLNKATFTNVSLPGPWTAQNMGTVGIPGSANYSAATDTYTLTGSGQGLGGVPAETGGDAAMVYWQKLTGNGSITARIASVTVSNSGASSGIIMRETLSTDSKYFAIWSNGNDDFRRNRRASTGGNSGSGLLPSGTDPLPTWARITRSGNSFTSWYSYDGVNWTQFSTAQSITMGAEIYIGLIASSGDTTTVNTSTFTNVRYTGQPDAVPPLNSLSAPTNVVVSGITSSSATVSWTSPNVLPGDFNEDNRVDAADYVVWRKINGSQAGYNAWQAGYGNSLPVLNGYTVERSSDGVHFETVGVTAADVLTYTDTSLAGNQRYYYRVRAKDALSVSVPSALAAVTTRAAAVTNLSITSYSNSQLVIQWKDASGETDYTLQRSTTGSETGTWTTIGSSTITKNTSIYVNSGLSAGTQYFYRVRTVDASGNSDWSAIVSAYTRVNSTPANLTFSSRTANSMTLSWDALSGMTRYAVYRGRSESDNEWDLLNSNVTTTTFIDTGRSPLTEYHYRVIGFNANGAASLKAEIFGATLGTTSVPSPWVSQDIGVVGGVGAAGVTGSTFKIVGSGGDVWGDNDRFHYVSQPLSGNGSITVRVASMENPAPSFYSRAGIMIRETTAFDSKYASLMLHPSEGGVRLQSRTSTGGNTSESDGPIVNAPYWLRLTRSGNTFTGEISTNGSAWTTIGSVNVTMGADVHVGMAVTARNDAYMHWGTFDNVSVTAAGSAMDNFVVMSSSAETILLGVASGPVSQLRMTALGANTSSSPSSSLDSARRRALDEVMARRNSEPHVRKFSSELVDRLARAALEESAADVPPLGCDEVLSAALHSPRDRAFRFNGVRR